MAILLPAGVKAGVRQKVERGHLTDAVTKIREATRLLNDQEQPLASVREKVPIGIDEPDRGGSVEGTAEPRQQTRESARRRAERDETLDPGVCPSSPAALRRPIPT